MSRFTRLTTRRVVATLAHVDDCRTCGELATTVRIDRLTGLCRQCRAELERSA